ncbi:MAG TPA: hypothetical protein VNH84_03820 [Candidatus Saccharimonadales bacterium]|nr:hypothetical protein [Candidatus Saccharimonadales bacterium]
MPRPILALSWLTAGVLLAPCGWADNRTASFNPLAALVPAGAPRSEFVDDREFGKDPFFPNSGRRPKTVVRTVEPDVIRPSVPEFLSLRGISRINEKKLAIINTYTVAEGEEFSLRSGTQTIRVKCVEIKDRSVVVSVNGATKELALRAGFQ